ncbi:type IV toxin-antitoxin system AbiEi family antitoxin domain-containing protein [Pseudokineococcus sp. 5B2Z-1]|uniref:type IV toxin-antitoxin system AbiEi family antitoxin domain-containing protein n=1 Tax=Pseudokineococcus sp. 5B2Z-1 TaxID=3132744 RepID=UPI0030AB2166
MDVRSLSPAHEAAVRRLTDVAARQDGVLGRADVLGAGASPQLVRSMVRRGEW